jgi:hypothetical protein
MGCTGLEYEIFIPGKPPDAGLGGDGVGVGLNVLPSIVTRSDMLTVTELAGEPEGI